MKEPEDLLSRDPGGRRFVGLAGCQAGPDAVTIRRFREALSQGQLVQELLRTLDRQLESRAFRASKGRIVDAGIVPVPKAPGSRREHEQIRAGNPPG